MYYQRWAPYVPVAERRRRALRKMDRLRKKGMDIHPVEIKGRKIAKTFWGQAWCDHIESLGDFANRLPRGGRYVRNGSVCHLAIEKGRVRGMVSGSDLYRVDVRIKVLAKKRWRHIKNRCAGQIGSLLELLQGHFSDRVMEVVTDPREGAFPLTKEIEFDCDCPDWATMCKHVAAVLYGVGARLDSQPEMLFRLRGVNHEELIDAPTEEVVHRVVRQGGRRRTLPADIVSDVFGIEIRDDKSDQSPAGGRSPKKVSARGKKKAAANTKKRSILRRSTSPKARKAKTASKNARDAKKKKLAKTKIKKNNVKPSHKKAAKKRSVKKRVSRGSGKPSAKKKSATSAKRTSPRAKKRDTSRPKRKQKSSLGRGS